MSRALLLGGVIIFGAWQTACTFYTACPDNNQQTPPTNNMGGAGGSGGSSSGTGASVSVGGEPPMGEWVNETFNLAGLESECGNLGYLSAKPDEDRLLVGVAQKGVFEKSRGGDEWTAIGQGQDSAVITNRASSFVFDPENPAVFWESGLYNAEGVFRTDDGGDTFVALDVMHTDSVSIDFSDPQRQTLLASGHEQERILNKSEDGGETWNPIGDTIPDPGKVCPYPLVLDTSTYLLGCGTYAGGDNAIFRSTDGGGSWEQVSEAGAGARPLVASDGTIYFPGEPNSGLVVSKDSGETWEGPFGVGELWAATPVELPDGRIAALGHERIVVSSDQGETWRVVSPTTPFVPVGIAYSTTGRTFYTWHWSCDTAVPDDAILSYDFDWEE